MRKDPLAHVLRLEGGPTNQLPSLRKFNATVTDQTGNTCDKRLSSQRFKVEDRAALSVSNGGASNESEPWDCGDTSEGRP
jgi:hypothetical protein